MVWIWFKSQKGKKPNTLLLFTLKPEEGFKVKKIFIKNVKHGSKVKKYEYEYEI